MCLGICKLRANGQLCDLRIRKWLRAFRRLDSQSQILRVKFAAFTALTCADGYCEGIPALSSDGCGPVTHHLLIFLAEKRRVPLGSSGSSARRSGVIHSLVPGVEFVPEAFDVIDRRDRPT